VLRKQPVRVAAGTAEAASAHITTLIARIRLLNGQLKEAHRQLDALTERLIPQAEAGPGQRKQHDVEILASLPGVGRIVLATLLTEAFDALQRRDYAALRKKDHAQHPAGRVGKPRDVAAMVALLLDRDRSGFVTGANFVIDGGMTRKMIYVE